MENTSSHKGSDVQDPMGEELGKPEGPDETAIDDTIPSMQAHADHEGR